MRILGVYIGGHDTNISIYNSEKETFEYLKLERIMAHKHAKVELPNMPFEFKEKIDIIVYSDGERNMLGKCKNEHELYKKLPDNMYYNNVKNELKKAFNCSASEFYYVDHHFAHVLSCWPIIETKKQDYGVVIDGRGDQQDRISIFKNPHDIIDSKFLKEGILTKPENILYKSQNFDAPSILRNIGRLMDLEGDALDIPGKIMGAHAYGNLNQEFIDHFLQEIHPSDEYFKFSSEAIMDEFTDSLKLDKFCSKPYNLDNKEFVDLLASSHHIVGEIIKQIFQKHCPKDSTITYSGGVAQNTVWNEILYNNFNNLYIPPHCYDGGLSLGLIEFARILLDFPLPNPPKNMTFPYIQHDAIDKHPDDKTLDKVVDLLAEGKIVAWFQGRGEAGPRALGNRSILMHPGIKNGKDIINSRVKNREYWRPFAPSVLEEYAHEWFEIDKPSPYMLRAVKAKKEKSDKIKSVVHDDYTSRIQTVNIQQNPLFHLLLTKFYEKTGIPLLLNTSLNAGGSPIMAHVQQVEKFFKDPKVDIDAACVGDKLFEDKK